jgi:DNA invertase Pin-like site-specific DNA recombinase
MPRTGKSCSPKNKAAERHAVVYIRTSSAANVGADKDSDRRQRLAIQGYAERKGLSIVAEFFDTAVSGADPVESRPGFAAMLDRIEGNGVRVVLVEDASRFARDLVAQELGVLVMQQRGVEVICANGDSLTETSDPARIMMRQVAGAFAQYEKARLVQKLKGARDRASEQAGKRVEGRKGYSVTNPELVKEAKRLARRNPKTGAARSLRTIASELFALDYVTATGKEFSPSQVQRLLDA